MTAPVSYNATFIADPATLFTTLWDELAWERRPDAPRREVFFNDFGTPYAYGRGIGRRTYEPIPWHPAVKQVQALLEVTAGVRFEGCFINGYEGPRDHLGWHSDDSPEIDDARPIGVISLGSERTIQFRPIRTDLDASQVAAESLLLSPGSLLLMGAGMQDTHMHRIPKHGANCGPRISLTFRGLI